MQRIATCLSENGYSVKLVGVKKKQSLPFNPSGYQYNRIPCFFVKGPAFYIEYNFRLFLFLLFTKTDIICAIDLDTILPCFFASALLGKKRVYDAHEFFTEQKEIIRRPFIKSIWERIESIAIPHFKNGYTVNSKLAQLFAEKYGANYEVIRNISFSYPLENTDNQHNDKFILYQGAVNEGRCFEQLIPAMKWVNAHLYVAGDGNFMNQTKQLIEFYKLEHKITLLGLIEPMELRKLTQKAYIGITLFEPNGINQYYSLANRFFDYMMAGTPQICVNYPLYQEINDLHGFAYLISDIHPLTIGNALNKLLEDGVLYASLRHNCLETRNKLNWENESKKLVEFYNKL
jgi:glycosyltransferase involved in cell wall biosynthesis